MSFLSTTVVSALNNYNSITPIVAKDLVENGGRTAMAYYSAGEGTRNYEAKEKFIEANATSLLWYGAIPFIKSCFDKTFFKFSKLNPDVSLELLKSQNNVQSINSVKSRIDNGLLPKTYITRNMFGKKTVNSVPDTLNSIQKNSGLFKKLHISRNALAVIIPTLLSAIVLPKAIIAFTQASVNKHSADCVCNFNMQNDCPKNSNKLKIKKSDNKNPQSIAFSGLGDSLLKSAAEAQKSLLPSMVGVDLAISGGRVLYAEKREREAQNNQISGAPHAAALEKLIREGGFLYLIYFGGAQLKRFIDKLTKNPLDPLVLEDKNFVQELQSDSFRVNPIKNMKEVEILDYIDKNISNDKNVFIKYAKKTGIIKTVKDKSNKVFRNPLLWLDTKKVNEFFEELSATSSNLLAEGGTSLQKCIAKKAKIKRAGIYANLALSSFAVCWGLPKIMYTFRKWYTGSNEDPGIKKVICKNCTNSTLSA